MTEIIVTNPSQPNPNQDFFLNYNNANIIPIINNNYDYILKNENDTNVSDIFNSSLIIDPINDFLIADAISYLIQDNNGNLYFVGQENDLISYNIYKATPTSTLGQYSITLFISNSSDPDLTNSNPMGLAFDGGGNLYVALRNSNMIKKYNPDGTGGIIFINDGNLNQPTGITFNNFDDLYVANNGNNKILVYIDGLLDSELTDVNLINPTSISFNNKYELFVTNSSNLIFNVNSGTFTQIANIPAQFVGNMVFDIDYNIYINDYNNDITYQIFYNTWTINPLILSSPIYPGKPTGINFNNYGDLILIVNNTIGGSNIVDMVTLYTTYWFDNVNLPAGYNSLKIYNLTNSLIVFDFTIYIQPTESPVITSIPSPPIEYQNFFLNYFNPQITPEIENDNTNTQYILKNVNGIDVSNIFDFTPKIEIINDYQFINSNSSYLIKDNSGNLYFAGSLSDGSGYNIFKSTLITETGNYLTNILISNVTYPDLTNSNPMGLAFDSQGYLYVALRNENKIMKFNSDGTGGIVYINDGLLNEPCGIAFDSLDNLYVANFSSNNIIKYDNFLSSTVYNFPSLYNPTSIGFNNLGELFITNENNYIFKVNLVDNFLILIADITADINASFLGNMGFDSGNNIYINDFNNIKLYKITYGNWFINSIIDYFYLTNYGRPSGLTILNNDNFISLIGDQNIDDDFYTNKFYSFNTNFFFDNVNLPSGYNLLKIYNLNDNSFITEFIIFILGLSPNPPTPDPGFLCFKKETKILCNIDGCDKYIPIEKIKEGMLVKTYKYGYKPCKFNMKELLKNTEEHNINNLYKQTTQTNRNLFEDLYITGSHSMLYDELSEKEDKAMKNLLETYNSKFETQISNKINDKYKLIAYFDKSFTEVKENKNVYVYHLVLESKNFFRNYGIWANGALTETLDEFTLFKYLNNRTNKLKKLINENNKFKKIKN